MTQAIQKNVSLQAYNTFNIDAHARYFFSLNHMNQLLDILHSDSWQSKPVLVLGGGSNILFTQDYPGLVIKNELKGIETIDENNDHIILKIQAGENWHQLVMYCVERNYGGIENLSLIPGTVGAAPMQNIGAYGVEICSAFESLEAIELATGKVKIFYRDDCQFGYRTSIFKNAYKNRYIITSVTLRLNKKPQLNTSYGALTNTLEAMGKKLSIQTISQAVIHIRQQKLPDPKIIPNAGSFFKNPIIAKTTFDSLKQQHPDIPYYPTENSHIKIPAGWLIEQCGWKGKIRGETGVHSKQALVLINRGHATGDDIQNLAQDIQASVQERFSILLTPEVNII